MNTAISLIGFDADDTLWHHEQFYQLTEGQFKMLLADYAAPEALAQHLLHTERRNLKTYGYGVKGYVLSMIETALELTDNNISAGVIRDIISIGREMLDHPIHTLPHVQEVLAALTGRYKIVLITKGDLFDQERKLAQSALGDFFDEVEIVTEKAESTYHRIFTRYGDGPSRSVMVGNSLKSDIIPALDAGAWGVHVPSGYDWALDHATAPEAAARFFQIGDLSELPGVLEKIQE